MGHLPEFGAAEELLLRIMRGYFYGDPFALQKPDAAPITVGSLIPDDMPFPFLFVRRDNSSGSQNLGFTDYRQAKSFTGTFQSFCRGIDADDENDKIQDAVRLALSEAVEQQQGFGDIGFLNTIRVWSPASRKTDYATSTGVVQYASLPGNVVRYESVYQIIMRPVVSGATDNPFIRH